MTPVRTAICLLALLVVLATTQLSRWVCAEDTKEVLPIESVEPNEGIPDPSAASVAGESPSTVAGETPSSAKKRTSTQQPPPQPAFPSLRIPPEGRTAPSGPDVYMLPDEEGKLRMVLGFRYEDFLGAWQNQDKGAQTSPPPYIYQSIAVSGEADDSVARLRIELNLLTQSDGWVEVPLQMPALIVRTVLIEKQLEGECVVFDPERQGYFVWLKSHPPGGRQLVLSGLLRLNLDAGDPSMDLHIPPAAKTDLVLRVPAADAQFQGPLGMTLESAAAADGATEVRMTGQASPLRLQWKSPRAQTPHGNLMIEAVGQQTVRIARRSIRYDVNLLINSFGTPLEVVRVRLPAGAKLTTNPSTDEYRIEPTFSVAGGRGQIVEIRTTRPRTAPWQIQLSAEQSIDDAEEEFVSAVSGFETLDALRQSGTLELQLDQPWQAYYDPGGYLEQIPVTDRAAPGAKAKTLARFEYAQFPWNLVVHVLPRQQRVSVRPKYELTIDSEEARLNVEFDYQLTGAHTFFLRIDMRGWRLTDDPLESDGTIDKSLYTETQQGLLNLPLLNPDTPRVPLNFVARMDVGLGNTTFPLPEPMGVFVADGLLTVRSEAALEVLPKLSDASGLHRIASPDLSRGDLAGDPSSLDVPQGRSAPADALVFRTLQPAPTLETELILRERQVDIEIDTHVNLKPQSIRVAQQLQYRVSFQPVSQLRIQTPEELWLNDSLRISLDGENVQFGLGADRQADSASADPLASAVDADSKRLIVALPRPLEGDFQLDISYDTPFPQLTINTPQPVGLPLVTPDDPVERHQVRVHYERPQRASLNQIVAKQDWLESDSSERAPDAGGLLLHTSTSPTTLPLLLQLAAAEKPELATLQQAWLQTWILADREQVRAVYRFRSPHQRAWVQLNEAIRKNEIEVLLEGQPVPFEQHPDDRLSVDLPPERAGDNQTLQLRFQRGVDLPNWGNLSSRLPILESRSLIAPIYWQLLLPAGWHVATDPEELSGDYWLGWKDFRWGRQPHLDQANLERLTGATTLPKPPSSTNQYLFQTFRMQSAVTVSVLRRLWVVLASIVIVFGVGLLSLYTSLVRQKAFWLILVMALFVLVLSRPEISLLVVQVILWGGAMTLLAAALRKSLAGEPATEFVFAPEQITGSTAATQSWSNPAIIPPGDTHVAQAPAPMGDSE